MKPKLLVRRSDFWVLEYCPKLAWTPCMLYLSAFASLLWSITYRINVLFPVELMTNFYLVWKGWWQKFGIPQFARGHEGQAWATLERMSELFKSLRRRSSIKPRNFLHKCSKNTIEEAFLSLVIGANPRNLKNVLISVLKKHFTPF